MAESALLPIMLGAQGVAAGAGVGSSFAQAGALRAQGRAERASLRFGTEVADRQAASALRRGNLEAAAVRREAKRTLGAQRASFGASGLDLTAGSAAELQQETQALGALDVLTVQNNAFREAWGFRARAQDLRSRTRYSRVESRAASRATLVTGGAQFVGDIAGIGQTYLKYRPAK